MTSLPVCDADITLLYTSDHRQGEATLAKKSTPSPPSVLQSEKLISSALNKYKHRKYSADSAKMSAGLLVQKQPEMGRRKSADSGIQSEYVDIDLYQDESSTDCDTLKPSQSNGFKPIKFKDKNDNFTNSTEYTENISEHGPVELMSMLDLLNSYEKKTDEKKVNSENSNECHSCFQKGKKDDDFPIYATVDKTTKTKPLQDLVGKRKVLKPIPVAPPKVPQFVALSTNPPAIPPKPKCLSEGFEKRIPNVLADCEHSPEMQVILNSLSPVLIRRNSKPRRKNSSSSEISPDSTPEVLPKGKVNQSGSRGHSVVHNSQNSLFMDPKMAKTWHGATSTHWSNVYGPQMRAMMRQLNNFNSEMTATTPESPTDSYEARCQTLPSKSLLDEMHKKFCADQYSEDKDVETVRAHVLFRLKHQPLIKPRRSQSFNIRMGTSSSYNRKGTNYSGSSGSSESSPMFPRASERVRIKTRPDVQYSPKPHRREATPEPLKIEEVSDQVRLVQLSFFECVFFSNTGKH